MSAKERQKFRVYRLREYIALLQPPRTQQKCLAHCTKGLPRLMSTYLPGFVRHMIESGAFPEGDVRIETIDNWVSVGLEQSANFQCYPDDQRVPTKGPQPPSPIDAFGIPGHSKKKKTTRKKTKNTGKPGKGFSSNLPGGETPKPKVELSCVGGSTQVQTGDDSSMHPSTNPSKIVRLIFGPGSNGGGGGGSGSSSNQHPRETELDHVEPAKEPVHTRVESRFDACIQPCLVNTMQSGFNLIDAFTSCTDSNRCGNPLGRFPIVEAAQKVFHDNRKRIEDTLVVAGITAGVAIFLSFLISYIAAMVLSGALVLI